MRAPLSWLRRHVDLPADADPFALARTLTMAGLNVEKVDVLGEGISGVVVARVLEVEELTGFKKPVRWVSVDDGDHPRQVICGATNFAAGDVVAYARPPARLPFGEITAKDAYGRRSDGMLCSARELGLGDDHSGILLLDPSAAGVLGADVVDVLGLRDAVFDLDVNPDRGYALSMRGLARELATLTGSGFRDPGAGPLDAHTAPGYDVRLGDPDRCDRYVARVLRGLDPAARSPQWLSRWVTLGGMRPVSLAVDVTNFVMLDLGQPLHAFDLGTLRGPIVVRRAAAGERLRTLDGVDRGLDPDDLVIADDSGPIALAGVMGGGPTEITAATTDILLESAHFTAAGVAATARRHKLGSEASRRYERGVDPQLAPVAAQAAIDLLVSLGGATADPAGTDAGSVAEPGVITVDPALPGRLTGTSYSRETVVLRLTQIGCAVEDSDRALAVTPPSWRPDLTLGVDLVEEVARLEGYDAIPSVLPAAQGGRGLTADQRRRRTVGRALAAAGWVEVLSWPFSGVAAAQRLGWTETEPGWPTQRLAAPLSDEEPYLRAALLPGLLDTVVRNVGRGRSDVALFETGSVFREPAGGRVAAQPLPPGQRPDPDRLAALERSLPDQPARLAVAACGQREHDGWWGAGRPVIWADAVDALRRAAAALDVTVAVATAAPAPYHPGRCAELSVGGVVIGHAGELHPRVVDAYGLPPGTVAGEMDLGAVLAAVPATATPAPAISAYPAATVDIALVVAAEVPAADVEAAVRAGAGPLLESVRLFDLYAGDPVPAGHRSLAYALVLRAADRTLTSTEAGAIRDAAVAEANRRTGATLRT